MIQRCSSYNRDERKLDGGGGGVDFGNHQDSILINNNNRERERKEMEKNMDRRGNGERK